MNNPPTVTQLPSAEGHQVFSTTLALIGLDKTAAKRELHQQPGTMTSTFECEERSSV
jgi:hypothetical protein